MWPDDALGWLTLGSLVLTQFGSLVAAVWAIFDKRFKKIEEKCQAMREKKVDVEVLNDWGKRVNLNEGKTERLDGLLGKLEYDIQGLRYKDEQISREITMVNDTAKELAKAFARQSEEHSKDVRIISEAVVRMEGLVKGIGDSRKGGN